MLILISSEILLDYIKKEQRVKLGIISNLLENSFIHRTELENMVTNALFKNREYFANIVIWKIDDMLQDKIIEKQNNVISLIEADNIRKAFDTEKDKVKHILNYVWGWGDFDRFFHKDIAVHIIARLILSGNSAHIDELEASICSDADERIGVFADMSSSSINYRKRKLIPETFEKLEKVGILERSNITANVSIPQTQFTHLLNVIGSDVVSVLSQLKSGMVKTIIHHEEKVKDLLNKFDQFLIEKQKLQEEISQLKKELDDQKTLNEPFKHVLTLVKGCSLVGIDADWVAACSALNMIEASVKKKLSDLNVSYDKIQQNSFSNLYELLNKMLHEKENRILSTRLIFTDIYKKARNLIDHEGHIYKPATKETEFIVNQTIDFINELFRN